MNAVSPARGQEQQARVASFPSPSKAPGSFSTSRLKTLCCFRKKATHQLLPYIQGYVDREVAPRGSSSACWKTMMAISFIQYQRLEAHLSVLIS
jgi:hypothetical protein